MLRRLALSVISWSVAGLIAFTVLRPRPRPAREVRRDPAWRTGLALQAGSIALLLAAPRQPRRSPIDDAATALAMALGPAGCAVIAAGERALGSQFAYQARLIEGHRLITSGPYRYARHPMYASAFAIVLALGLTRSRWEAFPPFLAMYWMGTEVRIRSEERLLREAFGEEYEEYSRRVAALIPGVW